MKKIAVIGAGATGLFSAYYLMPYCELTVFEKEDEPGGIGRSLVCDGFTIEKYNHFFSREDKDLVEAVTQLGLEDRLYWRSVRQMHVSHRQRRFLGTPWDFLWYPGLDMAEKISLLRFLANAQSLPHSRVLRDETAHEWVQRVCGKNVFRVFFEPFLRYKFGEDYKSVHAAYLWLRIKESKQNSIGYLHGSTGFLLGELTAAIKRSGVRLLLNSRVNALDFDRQRGWSVHAENRREEFDAVVSCVCAAETARLCPQLAQAHPELQSIRYLNVNSYLLQIAQPLLPGCWLFTVQTAGGLRIIIDTTEFTGRSFVYFPVYKEHLFGEEEKEKWFAECLRCLKKINPAFRENLVKKQFIFCDARVEPVLDRAFLSARKAAPEIMPGLYIRELSGGELLLKSLNAAVRKGKDLRRILGHKYGWNGSD